MRFVHSGGVLEDEFAEVFFSRLRKKVPVIVGEILDGRRVQNVGEQYDALRESAHIYARAASLAAALDA